MAVIFALQNTTTVPIAFLFWHTEGSLALLLLISVVIGTVIGLLAATPGSIKKSRTVSSLKKKLAALEKQLQEKESRIAELEAQIPSAETQITDSSEIESVQIASEPTSDVSVPSPSTDEISQQNTEASSDQTVNPFENTE